MKLIPTRSRRVAEEVVKGDGTAFQKLLEDRGGKGVGRNAGERTGIRALLTITISCNGNVIMNSKRELKKEENIIIGRDPNPGVCDIVCNEKTISGRHTQIKITKDEIEIIDLNSTNGTYFNGKKLMPNEKLKRQKHGNSQIPFTMGTGNKTVVVTIGIIEIKPPSPNSPNNDLTPEQQTQLNQELRDAVKEYRKQMTDTLIFDASGSSPALRNAVEKIKLLISQGADPKSLDPGGMQLCEKIMEGLA